MFKSVIISFLVLLCLTLAAASSTNGTAAAPIFDPTDPNLTEEQLNELAAAAGCAICPLAPILPCPCRDQTTCRLIPRTCLRCTHWICVSKSNKRCCNRFNRKVNIHGELLDGAAVITNSSIFVNAGVVPAH